MSGFGNAILEEPTEEPESKKRSAGKSLEHSYRRRREPQASSAPMINPPIWAHQATPPAPCPPRVLSPPKNCSTNQIASTNTEGKGRMENGGTQETTR